MYIPVLPEILRSKVAVLVELFSKRRELEKLNRSLERANAELAQSNSIFRAEKTRELEELNQRLTQANAVLAQTNAAVHAEIVERKQTQETLHESKEHLRLALTSARAGAWEWDVAAGSATWSPELYDLFGIDQGSVAPSFQAFVALIHPEDRDRAQAEFLVAAERAGPIDLEFRVVLPDGGTLWISSVGRVEHDAHGRPLRAIGINLDIGARKQFELALRDSERRKDEFLAILAHELRNPLNAISNAVKLLYLHGVEESEHEWSRDVIERQVEHLTRLINDLLDVSRITRNKLELRKERVELAEIIRGAVDGSRPLFDRGKHEVTVTLPANPVFVNADRIRLAQVFMNLLDNAAKYTPVGGSLWVTAEVTSGGSTPDSEEAVVRVRDTGVGISPEKLSQLFDMFYQVDVSLARAHGGLGIGLTLVRQLVEMHGGSVEALSRGLGKGSEFIVRVPVLGERSKTEHPEVLAGNQEMTIPAGRRILIADDNRDSAESMATLLRLLSNEVQTAYNGIDAVEMAKKFHPDIVLLDIGMPMLNGYDAVRAIREQPWSKNAVMVALTGWGQEEDRRRSREAGFDDHLIKPVDHTALMGVLARLPAGSSLLAGAEWRSASDSRGDGDPLQLIDAEPPTARRQDRPPQRS